MSQTPIITPVLFILALLCTGFAMAENHQCTVTVKQGCADEQPETVEQYPITASDQAAAIQITLQKALGGCAANDILQGPICKSSQ